MYGNEALLAIFVVANMLTVLLCYKLGRRWLECYIVIATVTIYCIAGKLFDFFSLSVTPTAATYSGIFLATDLLTENYGKKAGFRIIRIGAFATFLFIGLTQFALLFEPLPHTEALAHSMNDVFGTSLRISAASILSYVIAQHFDVWFYHFLHHKTGGRLLWLRNNLSTGCSQFIDSVIFFTLAFYGTVPNIVEVVIVGYSMKLAIAFIDTVPMYLSKLYRPLDLKDNQSV